MNRINNSNRINNKIIIKKKEISIRLWGLILFLLMQPNRVINQKLEENQAKNPNRKNQNVGILKQHNVIFRFNGSVQSNFATSEQRCKSCWNMDTGSSAEHTTKATEKRNEYYNSNHINNHRKDKWRIKQTTK